MIPEDLVEKRFEKTVDKSYKFPDNEHGDDGGDRDKDTGDEFSFEDGDEGHAHCVSETARLIAAIPQ